MSEVVKILGIPKNLIASICGVTKITRVVGIDFLVIIFGTVMSFLVPSEVVVDDIHTVDGDSVVSGDGDKWIATVSKDHADGKQLVSGTPEVIVTSEFPIIEASKDHVKTSKKPKKGMAFIWNGGRDYFCDVTDVSINVPDVLSSVDKWYGASNTLGSGVTVTNGITSSSATIMWYQSLAGEIDIEWTYAAIATSTVYGLVPSSKPHTGSENYIFNYATVDDLVAEAFTFYAMSGQWQYPSQTVDTFKGTPVAGETVFRITRDSDDLCTLYVDGVAIASKTLAGAMNFWASTHANVVNMDDFKICGVSNPMYEVVIDLAEAPTKMFEDPTQGEIMAVGAGTSNTSFESSDEVKPGDEFESDKGKFKAVTVTSSPVNVDSILINDPTGAMAFPSFFIDRVNKLPNGAPISHLGILSSVAQGCEGLSIIHNYSDANASIMAKTNAITHTGAGYEYFEIADGPYTVPETGDFYFQVRGIGNASFKTVPSGDALSRVTADQGVGGSYYTSLSTTAPCGAYRSEGVNYTADITAAGLTEAPTTVSRKADNIFAIGVGKTGEYTGKPVKLEMAKGDSLVPLLTAATDQGHTVTQTSLYSAGFAAWTAFSGNTAAGYLSLVSSVAPQGFTIKFDARKTIANYMMRGSTNDIGIMHMPKSWNLYGRDTGGEWELISAVTDQPSWIELEERDFVGKGLSYDECKLDITETHSGSGYFAIGGVKFFKQASTASSLVITSTESVKSKIFVTGGLHNNLDCTMADGSVVKAIVASISEEVVEGKTITTAILTESLPDIPVGVATSNRFLDLPCSATSEIVSEGLKLTGEKILFPENPELRSMAMAVKLAAGTIAKDFKITPERMG